MRTPISTGSFVDIDGELYETMTHGMAIAGDHPSMEK